jgi:predicted Zn-dependent peptidase
MTRGCGELSGEEVADRVEGAGAALRVEAHEDALVLALKCASADGADLLPLLVAMVRQPWIRDDQLELERQLNLQTLQRHREDPFQLAHDQLRHLLYGNGPYGHDPLGIEAELATLEASSLLPIVRDLGTCGAVLVLAGEPPDRVAALLGEALATSPWSTESPSPLPFEAEAAQPDRLALLEQDTEQLVLMLGTATVPMGHPDALALRVLQCHLGLGMSSRLFVVMREELGLAYEVGAHLPARQGAAPFVMHLSTSADRAGQATAALLNEWQRCLEEPLRPEELTLARAKFRGQDALGRQTCQQLAERQALVLSHGLPADHVARCLERVQDLDASDLQAAARTWLARPSLSLCGPAEAVAAAEAAWRGHSLGA